MEAKVINFAQASAALYAIPGISLQAALASFSASFAHCTTCSLVSVVISKVLLVVRLARLHHRLPIKVPLDYVSSLLSFKRGECRK